MVNYSSRLDSVFFALADPTRRRILEKLARKPLTVGEIAAGFSISQPAISKHVKVLEEARLLSRAIKGRVHYCKIVPKAMRDAATQKRRPFVRFFACEKDLSHDSPDAPLPDAVAKGSEPFLIVGAIAGG